MAGMYPLLQITGVDSYKSYTSSARGNIGVSEALATYNRHLAEKAIAGCSDVGRINLVVEDSGVYAATVPDASLDVVFLDKCLSMDSQRQDVVDWYSKVKTGGVLCGHDTWTDEIVSGVRKGLAEVGCKNQIEFVDDGVWFLRKG
jgi:citrate lyase alpha subunit